MHPYKKVGRGEFDRELFSYQALGIDSDGL